jgi:hypothetical protein
MIFTPVPVTPLMVVVKVLLVELLATVFTAAAVTATPFTVEVMVLVVLVSVCVVVAGAAFAGAHAVPFQANVCPLLAAVVVPSGDPFIFDTVVAPRLPVTSPVTLAVNAVAATPFTVLIN